MIKISLFLLRICKRPFPAMVVVVKEKDIDNTKHDSDMFDTQVRELPGRIFPP